VADSGSDKVFDKDEIFNGFALSCVEEAVVFNVGIFECKENAFVKIESMGS
jgi:hypothetical protein